MNVVLRKPLTINRFLAWEDRQEARHEFDGTRIIEMTGGARAHQIIVGNLWSFLFGALDRTRFDVIPEMRIVVGGRVRYPDVVVTAGPVGNSQKTLRDALVLFEVLSKETAETDLGAKKEEYLLIPSIQQYVLVAQDRRDVRVLQRDASGWLESRAEEEISVAAIEVHMPLGSVYRGVLD